MKKIRIKRYILALLVLISCHSTDAGWRDWFSWASWKQWFATTWISRWFSKQPEAAKTTLAGATTAFQQQQQVEQQLNKAIVTFVNRLKDFAIDLNQASINEERLSFDQLLARNEAILRDLDTIKKLGIPQSIDNLLNQTDNKIKARLIAIFNFLKSDLPWSSLQSIENLQKEKLPPDQIRKIILYLKGRYPKKFSDYINTLENIFKTKPEPVRLPEYIPMQDIFNILKKYKIDLAHSSIIIYKADFAKNIKKIYEEGLITVTNPADVSWFEQLSF